jgi:hypothetical protein
MTAQFHTWHYMYGTGYPGVRTGLGHVAKTCSSKYKIVHVMGDVAYNFLDT